MRKHLIILLLIVIVSIAKQSYAQTDSTKKQLGLVLKTDIFLPVFNQFHKINLFSITVEKLFKQRHSLQLTNINSWGSSSFGYGKYSFKTNSFQIIPEYKFFVTKKKAHTGYYVGAYLKYESYYQKSTEPYASINGVPNNIIEYNMYTISEGIINGVQFYFFNHLTLDILFGIGPRQVIKLNQIQGARIGNGGISLDGRAAINIGYKF